jgi:hypothetical protein
MQIEGFVAELKEINLLITILISCLILRRRKGH